MCEGILELVQHSDWAAPIVPVLKGDKSVQICGDFKMIVNQVSKLDRYPISRVEDLLATLAGVKTFTKFDMSEAYQQLVLDEKSRDLVVINTHRGLVRYTSYPLVLLRHQVCFRELWRTSSIISQVTGSTAEEH